MARLEAAAAAAARHGSGGGHEHAHVGGGNSAGGSKLTSLASVAMAATAHSADGSHVDEDLGGDAFGLGGSGVAAAVLDAQVRRACRDCTALLRCAALAVLSFPPQLSSASSVHRGVRARPRLPCTADPAIP